MVELGIPEAPHDLSQMPLIRNRLTLTGSLIGGMKETQACMDFCAEKGIVVSHEIIKADRLDEIYRILEKKNDSVKRYVLDCQNSERGTNNVFFSWLSCPN